MNTETVQPRAARMIMRAGMKQARSGPCFSQPEGYAQVIRQFEPCPLCGSFLYLFRQAEYFLYGVVEEEEEAAAQTS